MKKKEASFTTKFRGWAKRSGLPSGAYEVKHTRGGDSFKCGELKEHQYNALRAASSTGIVFKIPDDGLSHKPFDLFILRDAAAFVVICYPKAFVLIDIKDWKKKKTSLSFKDASYAAKLIVPLRDL